MYRKMDLFYALIPTIKFNKKMWNIVLPKDPNLSFIE